jgi:hypothetical protein
VGVSFGVYRDVVPDEAQAARIREWFLLFESIFVDTQFGVAIFVVI